MRTELDLLMPVKRVRVNTSDHDSRGSPSTWNRLYLKGRRAFKNTILNQLSLGSTITQSTASENHLKLSSLKPRYKARKKKTQRHGRERQNVFLVYAGILGPCVTIFMGRVLMNHLHRNWRTLSMKNIVCPAHWHKSHRKRTQLITSRWCQSSALWDS